jgi:hypothetical protein
VLLVYPVLLSKGKRFFAEGTPPRAFELASTKTDKSSLCAQMHEMSDFPEDVQKAVEGFGHRNVVA